jgi:hypothetical protein
MDRQTLRFEACVERVHRYDAAGLPAAEPARINRIASPVITPTTILLKSRPARFGAHGKAAVQRGLSGEAAALRRDVALCCSAQDAAHQRAGAVGAGRVEQAGQAEAAMVHPRAAIAEFSEAGLGVAATMARSTDAAEGQRSHGGVFQAAVLDQGT